MKIPSTPENNLLKNRVTITENKKTKRRKEKSNETLNKSIEEDNNVSHGCLPQNKKQRKLKEKSKENLISVTEEKKDLSIEDLLGEGAEYTSVFDNIASKETESVEAHNEPKTPASEKPIANIKPNLSTCQKLAMFTFQKKESNTKNQDNTGPNDHKTSRKIVEEIKSRTNQDNNFISSTCTKNVEDSSQVCDVKSPESITLSNSQSIFSLSNNEFDEMEFDI